MSFQKKTYTSLLFLILIVFYGCSSSNSKNEPSLNTLTIPFNEAVEKINFSELIDTSVVVIPLESDLSKGAFLNTINQLEIKGEEIYALDYLFNPTVQVFDRSGKFLRKIGKQGQAPGEYLQPMGFLFSKDTLEVLDAGKILKFDLNGNFLTSSRYEGFTASSFRKTDEGYAFITSGADEDNLVLTDNKLSKVSSHFPYKTRALNPILLNPIYSNPKGNIIYRRNLIDTLFELSDTKIPKPYLAFDYGEKKVNLNQLLASDNPERTIQDEIGKYAKTLYFFEGNNYYYLAFVLESEIWIMIKSNISGKSVLFKNSNMNNDVMVDQYSFLVGVSGDTFYFISKPERIIPSFLPTTVPSAFESHKKKLEELVKKLDREGNPVLFGVKFNF
mgnify:CR=1 FL=1